MENPESLRAGAIRLASRVATQPAVESAPIVAAHPGWGADKPTGTASPLTTSLLTADDPAE